MNSVSLYVRRKDDRYQKCSPKAVYVLGTSFVLRYEGEGRRRWEKLPSGWQGGGYSEKGSSIAFSALRPELRGTYRALRPSKCRSRPGLASGTYACMSLLAPSLPTNADRRGNPRGL